MHEHMSTRVAAGSPGLVKLQPSAASSTPCRLLAMLLSAGTNRLQALVWLLPLHEASWVQKLVRQNLCL